jgi:NADH-quinone oxidoreductase subunit A
MCIGALIGSVIIFLSGILGPRITNRTKELPFECGVQPVKDRGQRFSVRFYLVAILFLLFDVEAIFFFPFAVVFRDYLSINSFIILEMAFFVGLLIVGYIYVLRKGALEWD